MHIIWLARFELNLPCRPVDLEEISRTIPELLDENFEFHCHGIILRHHRYIEYLEYWRELRQWVRNVQQAEIEVVHPTKSSEVCPLSLCPMKKDMAGQCPEQGSSLSASEIEVPVFQLMTLGGKIGAREASAKRAVKTKQKNNHVDSMSEFRNLLSKVHPAKDGKNIVSIVLTDPYIHMGFDVGGTYLFKYLNAVGLNKGTNATLKISPRVKKNSAGFKKIEDALKAEYQNMTLAHHNSKDRRFHDRFFIVQYSNGVARGVFGPSINSIGSDDVYLMGELEPHCVAMLSVKEL